MHLNETSKIELFFGLPFNDLHENKKKNKKLELSGEVGMNN